ncbi:dual specificity protein phosphatase family protein [bacterium]|nr:dual specificity protein phosphatase family protein [bacterium]
MEQNLFWIPGPWKGKLAVAARPRGGDWLADELDCWKKNAINFVVSLLESSEVREFELQDEEAVAKKSGMQFVNFPIPDYGVPPSRSRFCELVATIYNALANGDRVVVHCRQGIGRSGLIAAALFMLAGETPENAIDLVSRHRGMMIPETPEQRKWLIETANTLLDEERIRLRA